MTLTVEIARLEEEIAATGTPQGGTPDEAESEPSFFGLAVTPLTDPLRRRYNVHPDAEGLLITQVDPNSDAAGKVREGDVIEVKEKSRELPVVLEGAQSNERDMPDYLDVDHGKMTGTFTRIPKLEDVPYPVQMEPNLVVEFYSR